MSHNIAMNDTITQYCNEKNNHKILQCEHFNHTILQWKKQSQNIAMGTFQSHNIWSETCMPTTLLTSSKMCLIYFLIGTRASVFKEC